MLLVISVWEISNVCKRKQQNYIHSLEVILKLRKTRRISRVPLSLLMNDN